MRVLLCAFFFVSSHAHRVNLNDKDYDEDSPMQSKVDVFPAPFRPVPFGHITLEGIEDPLAKQKPPVDPLELDMIAPRNREEAMAMLQKGRRYIQFAGLTPGKVPRDIYLNEKPIPRLNASAEKWYNFPETLRRNIMYPSNVRAEIKAHERGKYPPKLQVGDDPKVSYFDKYTFQLKEDLQTVQVNWTTCDEFGVKAVFSPKHIVDIEWVPFYIWSDRPYRFAIVHRFKHPTVKIVDQYKIIYKTFNMNKTLDWSQPKLLMQGLREMLLIAADRKGLFDAIPKQEIPDSVKKGKDKFASLPSLQIRLKIEDPYLVMMFCQGYFATAMAISGTEPTKYKEMKLEAASIKFNGTGRPVWRDLEGERERARLIAEQKMKEGENKFINIRGPVPRMDDEDYI